MALLLDAQRVSQRAPSRGFTTERRAGTVLMASDTFLIVLLILAWQVTTPEPVGSKPTLERSSCRPARWRTACAG